MRTVRWLAYTCFVYLIVASLAYGEDADRHSETIDPGTQVQDPGVQRGLRRLEQGPVDGAWLERAQALLDRMTSADARRALVAMEEGRPKQALRQLIRARFELSPSELDRAVNNRLSDPDLLAAARNEKERRLHRDPAVRLLAQAFQLRPEGAMIQEDNLRKAIDREDEASAAMGILSLLGSVDRGGHQQLAQELADLGEVSETPNLQRLVQRLRWALEEKGGKPRGPSVLENRFKDAIGKASAHASDDGQKFRDLLKKAAEGDQDALAQLKREYGEAGLLDFMAAHPDTQNSLQILRALGWKDKDGKVYLDVKNGNRVETWVLGEKDDELRQNLRDFLQARGQADHVTGLELASPSGPRAFVSIDPQSHQPRDQQLGFVVPEDPAVCHIPGPPLMREIALQKRPNYFFRPFPDSDSGSYAGVDENFLVDFGDGTTPPREYQVPGRWDPVPTPDEKFMTVPSNHKDIEGLTFFPMSAMRKPPFGKQKALYEDKQMRGVYQSLGIVGHGDGGATTYRAIVANGETLRVRDYTIKPDPSQPGGERVEPKGREPLLLCSNLKGLKLSLPMISKNGKQLAAVDVKDGVTKIYNLADDGTCSEDINLGIFTGKVDFGYDNDTITFHAFNNNKKGTDYIEVPSDDRVSNVYVYKRSTREMIRITNNTNQNSVYPAFRRDGSLVFLQHPHGAAVDNPEKSKLVVVDPKRYDKALFDHFTPGDADAAKRLNALTALGTLWAHVCSTDAPNLSRQSAVLSTLSLDPARCQRLIDQYWEKGRDQIFEKDLPNLKVPSADLKQLKKEDLQAVCRGETASHNPPASEPVRAPADDRPRTRSGSEIVGACLVCHDRAGYPKIPFDDPAALRRQMTTIRQPPISLAEDIVRRLHEHDPRNGRMPPGTALSAQEISTLVQYLRIGN